MAINTTLESASTTAASNGPSGSDQRTLADDGLRQYLAFIKSLKTLAVLASATTVTPPSTANAFSVTGTTAITTIASTNSWDGRDILFIFAGILTLTNGSNLILPGSANITTAVGDAAWLVQTASGQWRCVAYTRADGSATVTTFVAALGAVGTPSYTFTGDLNTGMYSPGADQIAWSTAGVQGMNMSALGNLGLGAAAFANTRIRITGTPWVTTGTSTAGVLVDGNIPSNVTGSHRSFNSNPGTDVAVFTATNIFHYDAGQSTIGAGSAVTNQFGFAAEASLVGATNNYGFWGNIPTAANRYNLYMTGSAPNYLNGITGIGQLPTAAVALAVTGTAAGTSQTWTDGTRSAAMTHAAGVVRLRTTTTDSLELGANTTSAVAIANGGNVTINAPSSGPPLTLSASAAASALVVADGTVSSRWYSDASTGIFISTTSNHALTLQTNGVSRVTITNDGRLYGTALHNNAGAVTGTTNQYLASGTYTATITDSTNVSGHSVGASQWIRVGNVVTVSGSSSITTSGAGVSLFRISLPIASNLASIGQLAGAGGSNAGGASSSVLTVYEEISTDQAETSHISLGAGTRQFYWTFTYVVV